MVFWLWAAIGILIGMILVLLYKLAVMRKAAREIEAAFASRLAADTNTLIDLSSQDKTMRSLAQSLNVQLRILRRLRRRYQQGDLELKEAVTNISHDLRTPLTAIYGYLELLEREEKTEAVQQYLLQIKNRAEALKQLSEELLRYFVAASVPEAVKETVDLRRCLEECLLSFYGAIRQKGIAADISLPEKSVERILDAAAVNRIFSNIISNALKYSDKDLKVTMDEEGRITFSNAAPKLDAVTAGRLFDRFYTVENGRNSTGLGLSIAKLLTERMGGSIDSAYNAQRLSITVSFPDKIKPA